MDMKALYSFKENHMQYLESLLSRINSYFWDGPMLIVLSLFHLYFTVHTRCVQRKLLKGIRYSVTGMITDSENQNRNKNCAKKFLPKKRKHYPHQKSFRHDGAYHNTCCHTWHGKYYRCFLRHLSGRSGRSVLVLFNWCVRYGNFLRRVLPLHPPPQKKRGRQLLWRTHGRTL